MYHHDQTSSLKKACNVKESDIAKIIDILTQSEKTSKCIEQLERLMNGSPDIKRAAAYLCFKGIQAMSENQVIMEGIRNNPIIYRS